MISLSVIIMEIGIQNLKEKKMEIKKTIVISAFPACGKSWCFDNLKDKFDTSNVTMMIGMFNGTGALSMTSFNLGDKFNTAKVTDMTEMFSHLGYNVTSLDLGDLFYTTSATDMTNMFRGCGQTSMTVLDLGPAFTKIAERHTDFMTDCGTSDLKVYASEAIYKNVNTFK